MQAGLAEGADGPGVVVVGRQSCFPTVQPGNPRAVDEMRPAHLSPRQTSCEMNNSRDSAASLDATIEKNNYIIC